MKTQIIGKEKLHIRDFIGNKDFYKKVLAIALPIMLQNGITNFVGMLDNIMVGRVGTEQMSGVSIVNQLLFILMRRTASLFALLLGRSQKRSNSFFSSSLAITSL